MVQWNMADIATHMALQTMAFHFNYLPRFKKYLKSDDGWINFSLGMRTEEGNVRQCIIFHDGRVRVSSDIPDDVDTEMVFADNGTLKDMASLPPNEVLNLVLKNRLIVRGNLVFAQLFSFFITLFAKGKIINTMKKQAGQCPAGSCSENAQPVAARAHRIRPQLTAPSQDPGVVYLDDPYLSGYSLADFPRLQKFLDIHFTQKPAICHERPLPSPGGSGPTALKSAPTGAPGCPNSDRPMRSNISWRTGNPSSEKTTS